MQYTPAALHLVEKINEVAASSDFFSARAVLAATHLNNPVLSSAEEYDVLLYTEDVAEQALSRKRKFPFLEHTFYFYSTSLLTELKVLPCSACERRIFTLSEFPPT